MNKAQISFLKKSPVIFFIVITVVAAIIVCGASIAIAAGETYQLTVRCDEGVVPNTYKICKIADVDGNLDSTNFDWTTYKSNHPETSLMSDEQIMRSIRERLKDNDGADVGELARLTNPTSTTPTITSHSVDPTPVTLYGGSYVLVSDTACPLLIGLDDYTQSNVEVAEKNEGTAIHMHIKNFDGQFLQDAIMPQNRIAELKAQIDLPKTFEQYTSYPLNSEIAFNEDELKLAEGPTVIINDGTDITNDVTITIENGKINIDFGDIKDKFPGITFENNFDINCAFAVDNNAKTGNDSPKIYGTVTYPVSPTRTGSTITTMPEYTTGYLLDLAIFVCNRDTGDPYQGISFVIENPNGEWFSSEEPCWVSREEATVYTTASSGYINLGKGVGAGTYILHQLNNAEDNSSPLSDQTTINLSGEILFGNLIVTANAQGAGSIMNIDNETGQVLIKIDLGDGWSIIPGIPQTLDRTMLLVIAAVVLLLCSSLIFIQRKRLMKKRG